MEDRFPAPADGGGLGFRTKKNPPGGGLEARLGKEMLDKAAGDKHGDDEPN